MSAKRLRPELKTFIVQCLARYYTPKQVIDLVRQEFGEAASYQLVQSYDPNTVAGGRLRQSFKDLFQTTRQKFLEEIDQHAITHLGYRLARLQRMSEAAESKGNYPLAALLLKQAAEDLGGCYTNHSVQDLNVRQGATIVRLPAKQTKEDWLRMTQKAS